MDHDIGVVPGCEVKLWAHGTEWHIEWADLIAIGGTEALGLLACPGCRVPLNDTEGDFTLGVCITHAHSPS